MFDLGLSVGNVMVHTTTNRGFTPEELADRALDKIIYVGSQSHPAIRDQAEAFREQIRSVIVFYMKEAIREDRTTLVAQHPELSKLLF